MKHLSICFVIGILACNYSPVEVTSAPPTNRAKAVKDIATAFFDTYAERSDWEQLLSFYRQDMVFEDVMLQLHLDSLWQFERFYNWPDTNFRKLSPEQLHMEVEHLLVNDRVAIASGHFNPFYWHGQLIDLDWGMQFQMTLYFDENLKISKQVDWIEYDDAVLESVIKRYREVGIDKPPAWLDLRK